MTPERWQQLKALFHAAMDQPSANRERWLADAVGEDASLLNEVTSLLRAHEAHSPLDHPLRAEPATPVSVGADSELAPGTQIGALTIEHEIGRGGMGVVYKAFDTRLQRPVAVKVLSGPAAADPMRRKRLQNEALLAATVNHSGIATVYRLDEVGGALYLSTEYIEGHTLRSEIVRGPLGLQRALTFTRDILFALDAAHQAGIVHRDLKPENVMVTASGTVKIVDFGIARSERFAMTRVTSGGPPGTPAYMAPEQLAGADADARADLFAVGVMLAEMVSGVHPGMPALPRLPSQLQSVVDRALARDAAQRFQSAREMADAISDLQDRPASADAHTLSWWRFHQCAAAAIYWLMTMAAWNVARVLSGATGRLFIIGVLLAVVVSSLLRLHLCFTSYSYQKHLAALRRQVGPIIRLMDIVFAATLAIGGLMLGEGHSSLMVLLVAVAAGSLVAAVVIEPATSRAAFETNARM